jgi:hypothetical protein
VLDRSVVDHSWMSLPRQRPPSWANDPRFSEKLTDVVGLYLNPPEKAIVLCVDEKSQIQALDRTQASLPADHSRTTDRLGCPLPEGRRRR